MAHPFGLEAGSTPPFGMAKYNIIMHSVPKPHPAFKSYTGEWRPEVGLVRILGKSDIFSDEGTAISARKLYDQVKRQLTQLYGAPKEIEEVAEGTVGDEKDFYMDLDSGDRTHTCEWEAANHALTDNVEKIVLMVEADDAYHSSFVTLRYDFAGFENDTAGDEYGLESL